MPRRALILAVSAALVLLGACTPSDPNGGPPNGNGEPPLGQADLDTAVGSFAGNAEAVGIELLSDDAVVAMEAFMAVVGGVVVVPVEPPPEEAPPIESATTPASVEELPRGVLAYDPVSEMWEPAGESDDLVLRWSFVAVDEVERDAELVVDWGTTRTVEGYGGAVEVPTDDMNVALTVDGSSAAAFDVEVDWYSAAACPAGILEPTRIAIDGSMGTDATLSLNGVSLSLTATVLSSSGEIVAAAGSDAVGVDWDVALDVVVDRGSDCSIQDLDVDGGSVSVTLFSDTAGTRSSLGLNVDFGNIEFEEEYGYLESIDLDGSITIDGAPVVSFTGTLDDADGDGTLGDNLVLTFADGETMTFEAFLQELMAETAGAVARALSFVR